ncbi:hypothetical protein ETC01_17395 [Geobacillus sp. NFOSA3]|nr:hypothetical protein [Geobacillus sp. NFOSA3]
MILSDVSGSTKEYSTYANILTSGNSYQVIVENVMDTTYKTITKYESDVKAFLDSEAPKLIKAEYVGGKVKLYFNEPVNPATVDYKVDGGTLRSNGSGLTSKIEKDQYILEFTPTTDERSVGNHTVTLYEVDDALGNREVVASATYSVGSDTTAPSVVSVTPDGMYTFKVKFSEPLSGEPTVTVKKGSLTLPLDNTFGGNGIALDTSDSSNTTYIVKVKDLDANNKVYDSGETSVNLSVNVKGYSDTANIAGAEFNGTVTLGKDTTAPSVVNVGLNKGVVVTGSNNDQLTIVFNEDLDRSYSTDGVDDSKITVKKDGIVLGTVSGARVINDADGNPRVVQIDLGADLTPGTYTVELGAGAVADTAGNKNAAITTSVNHIDNSVFVSATITMVGVN